MKNSKRQGFLRLAVSLVLMIAMMSCSVVFAAADIKAGSSATVKVGTTLNFRSQPSTSSSVIGSLKNGTEVTVLGKSGNWYKIRIGNGKTGYVYSKYLVAAAPKVVPTPAPSPAPAKNEPTASTEPVVDVSKLEKEIVLATTTSTKDTGLLDVLVPAFEKKYGVSVKTVAVGTGEAINMGKKGDADVLLVHSRTQEDAFVDDGYGVNRKDVMYNFFFIVGPKDDPAGVEGSVTAVEAFKKIAASKATFISRADKSGTNTKELSIWKKAELSPNAQTDKWYVEAGQGMGATLTMADEMGAYTLVDSGTWYAYESKLNMKIVTQKDNALYNPYGVIAVNPAKYPNINYNTAMAFVYYITSREGQELIGDYQKNGHQLFVPSAR